MHISVTLLYLLGQSEKVPEKVQDEIPAAWDPRVLARVGRISSAGLGTKRDLFSCSREGWPLTAVTDLETPRVTRRGPSIMNVVKVFTIHSLSREIFEEI